MNRLFLLGTLVAVGALLAAAVPTSAGPDCTCDPNPATDLLHCLVGDDSYCPILPGAPGAPGVPALPDLRDLDPRNWPCTCDPMPQPLDVTKVLA
jgi:hypothetical protein